MTGRTCLSTYNLYSLLPTNTVYFWGQLSREHATIMSCSTFRTDGKCAACCCSAPPFPHPLSFTWVTHLPTTTGSATTPDRRDIEWKGWGQSEAVEKCPHPPHQYCSLTWWKLTLASIFHRVIGREDQMPWLDTQTLLPVQMMTHRSLHYSWHLQMRGRSQ